MTRRVVEEPPARLPVGDRPDVDHSDVDRSDVDRPDVNQPVADFSTGDGQPSQRDGAPIGDDAPVALAIELLRRGRPVEIVAGGGSMWPLVRDGDRLVLDPAIPPRVGDLAAVERNGRLVVHRVIRLSDAGVLLRGDNTGGPDPVVTPAEVLGVVTRQVLRMRLRMRHSVNHRLPWMRVLNRIAAHTIRLGRRPRRMALAFARMWHASS